MTVSIEMALQEALDDILSPVLAPIPLFDQAPQDQAYPFAEFARMTFKVATEYTLDQQIATVSLAVYSNARGRREVTEAMAKMRAALHMQAFPIAGGNVVNAMYEQADAVAGGDGVSWIGTILFTVTVEPTPA